MPRKARIDAPGALHHVIVRGIERRKIFLDDTDREDFIERLSNTIDETQTACFAWALIPNHFHLLGYRAFFKKGECPWQNTEYVLKQFGSSISIARKKLREFMEKGIAQGRRDDLVGGGLIRSAGGWAAVKALKVVYRNLYIYVCPYGP